MLENAAELCDNQEFSEAIKIYDRVLNNDSKNIGALIDKATTLQRIGENKKSIEFFDSALEIDPKNVRDRATRHSSCPGRGLAPIL